MRTFTRHFLALAALFTTACTGSRTHSVADFTVAAYTPSYASGFDIRSTEDDSTTLVTIRNPWQGAAGVVQHLLILRGSAQAPSDFDGQVVKAPVHRVVCMSSSHVAMFDAIGEVHRVKGVSGIDYISNDYINAHRTCGEVRDVGYDTNIDFETLMALRPDLVLLYAVTGENSIVTGKLRELHIPYIYIGDYMEESPQGKAEWLLVAAELCNRREQGRAVFEGIAARYEAIKAGIAAQADGKRLRVMLNTPYRDTWFMPSTHSFMVRLVEDAGGAYIYPQNDGDSSVAIDLEQAYVLANQADVWVNTGACNNLGELKAQTPKFADIPVVRSGQVFNNNRRQTPSGGSDFWESGVIRPDLVLHDLARILQGRADSLHYYKRLE